jgi:preprotein translocase subunit YajC
MIPILAAGGTQSGGSLFTALLPLIVLGGVFYFFLLRPNRTRARQQQALLDSLEVGDEVMTAGGIFGTIKEIDEDEGTVTVEIAPGTDVRMLRRAISQRMTEDEEPEDEDEEDADTGADTDPDSDEEAGSRP